MKPPFWIIATCAILGSLYFAWTAFSAMRTDSISVQRSFLGFTWWGEVNSDDQPFQFWFAVIGHWIASAACLVGLVLILMHGNFQ